MQSLLQLWECDLKVPPRPLGTPAPGQRRGPKPLLSGDSSVWRLTSQRGASRGSPSRGPEGTSTGTSLFPAGGCQRPAWAGRPRLSHKINAVSHGWRRLPTSPTQPQPSEPETPECAATVQAPDRNSSTRRAASGGPRPGKSPGLPRVPSSFRAGCPLSSPSGSKRWLTLHGPPALGSHCDHQTGGGGVQGRAGPGPRGSLRWAGSVWVLDFRVGETAQHESG